MSFYVLSVDALVIPLQSEIVETEITWLGKQNMFTLYPSTENFINHFFKFASYLLILLLYCRMLMKAFLN